MMKVSVSRFANNPLLTPGDLAPSRPDFEVTCVLNPGAFRFGGRIGLLLRVAERPVPEPGFLATPILTENGAVSVIRVREDDPGISSSSSRSLVWNGRFLLTTMSHFLIAWSDDGGRTFTPDYSRRLLPEQSCEAYGIEDAPRRAGRRRIPDHLHGGRTGRNRGRLPPHPRLAQLQLHRTDPAAEQQGCGTVSAPGSAAGTACCTGRAIPLAATISIWPNRPICAVGGTTAASR